MLSEILFSEAADRNKQPIKAVLDQYLTNAGTILELASGSGQHIAYFAPHFPSYTWQPSEFNPSNLASISHYCSQSGAQNITDPIILDVHQLEWGVAGLSAILSINMIHASTPQAAPDLFRGSSQALEAHGLVILYGPFKFRSGTTAPSNLAFDDYMRAKNPNFGLWFFEDLVSLAQNLGFSLVGSHDMPANNHVQVFKKISSE
jgi:cyclopropane fatty-acyl-phospholipid synthase-like methyltransferase